MYQKLVIFNVRRHESLRDTKYSKKRRNKTILKSLGSLIKKLVGY